MLTEKSIQLNRHEEAEKKLNDLITSYTKLMKDLTTEFEIISAKDLMIKYSILNKCNTF